MDRRVELGQKCLHVGGQLMLVHEGHHAPAPPVKPNKRKYKQARGMGGPDKEHGLLYYWHSPHFPNPINSSINKQFPLTEQTLLGLRTTEEPLDQGMEDGQQHEHDAINPRPMDP